MSVSWTQRRTDLRGSRWTVWETKYKNLLPWNEFKDTVVRYNPNLNRSTGWCFVFGHQYITPQRSEPVPFSPVETRSEKILEGVPYHSQLEN